MSQETIGWMMIVLSLVLICGGWIVLAYIRVLDRARRLWHSWNS
jgi:hypothetical protein